MYVYTYAHRHTHKHVQYVYTHRHTLSPPNTHKCTCMTPARSRAGARVPEARPPRALVACLLRDWRIRCTARMNCAQINAQGMFRTRFYKCKHTHTHTHTWCQSRQRLFYVSRSAVAHVLSMCRHTVNTTHTDTRIPVPYASRHTDSQIHTHTHTHTHADTKTTQTHGITRLAACPDHMQDPHTHTRLYMLDNNITHTHTCTYA
jgi:hypothetical protein